MPRERLITILVYQGAYYSPLTLHAARSPRIGAPMRHSRETVKAFKIKLPFRYNYRIKSQKNQLQNNILPSKKTKPYFIYLPIGNTPFKVNLQFVVFELYNRIKLSKNQL